MGSELGWLWEVRAQTLTLTLRHRTVLVLQEYLLHTHNLFPQLSNLGREVVVFVAEQLHLCL